MLNLVFNMLHVFRILNSNRNQYHPFTYSMMQKKAFWYWIKKNKYKIFLELSNYSFLMSTIFQTWPLGFPCWLRWLRIHLQYRKPGFDPRLRRYPRGGHGVPIQYSCLESPHGQRSLAIYSPWVCKESDMTEWLSTAQHHGNNNTTYLWLGRFMTRCTQSTWLSDDSIGRAQ